MDNTSGETAGSRKLKQPCWHSRESLQGLRLCSYRREGWYRTTTLLVQQGRLEMDSSCAGKAGKAGKGKQLSWYSRGGW
jgi:hypothetical protein